MSSVIIFYPFLYIELLDNFVKLQYGVMSAMFTEGRDAKAAFDGSTWVVWEGSQRTDI